MIKFYTLSVKKVIRETEDAVSIVFEVPQELKTIFQYKNGQYITLKIPVNGKDNRRAYSLSSSPIIDDNLTVTIKKVDDGLVSSHVNESIKVGDRIEVMPPEGYFTIDLDRDNFKSYIMISGGSGITPLMSMIKSILAFEINSQVTLIYANRNENTIIFKHVLEELEKEYHNRFNLINVLSKPSEHWIGLAGRLNSEILKSLFEQKLSYVDVQAEFYICGPQGMMKEVEIALEDLKISKNKIHTENFVAKNNQDVQQNKIDSMENENIARKVKIILYGEELHMTVQPDDNIVTAAQSAGFDPPYSCQIGACSTCRAKLKSGKVMMEECDSLTEEEIKEGYILTCQSHPLTDDCVIDFDEN